MLRLWESIRLLLACKTSATFSDFIFAYLIYLSSPYFSNNRTQPKFVLPCLTFLPFLHYLILSTFLPNNQFNKSVLYNQLRHCSPITVCFFFFISMNYACLDPPFSECWLEILGLARLQSFLPIPTLPKSFIFNIFPPPPLFLLFIFCIISS